MADRHPVTGKFVPASDQMGSRQARNGTGPNFTLNNALDDPTVSDDARKEAAATVAHQAANQASINSRPRERDIGADPA